MAAIKNQPAPKPSQLPASPAKAAVAEADDFWAAGEEAIPEEMAAPAPNQEPGLVSQGLDYAGRALDYAGGIARTGLASSAGVAQDVLQGKNPLTEPPVVNEEDVMNALKGKAPDSAEYLRRLGVPEGGSIKLGNMTFTTRGAAGFAADIATDPLTQVVKLAKKLPYLKKLINSEGTAGMVNKATEALGEAVYKSALPKGAEEAGETLIRAGAPVGGTARLAQKVEELSNTMGKLRQGLYDKATELGVTIDAAYPLKRAEATLSAMKKDPGLAPQVQELEGLLMRYKEAGKVPVDIMSEWKSHLYDALPASAWEGGRMKKTAQRFKMALAADFREAIEQAGNKAQKGLGDSINALNDKWGTLLSATRPLEKATQATGGKLGLMIDGAVAATGGPQAYALKKGFDVATGTGARTLVGKALMEAGKKDVASRLVRQSAADMLKQGALSPMQPEQATASDDFFGAE